MSFDRIARYYRCLETLAFGAVLQKARTCWIETIAGPERVLIVGEGNGRFLCEFLRAHPNASVDCVDASARMLELARKRLRGVLPAAVDSVRFLQEDVISWSPSNDYDLLVANFVLDCFARDELNSIIAKLAQAAQPDARLLLADFSVPPRFLSRTHAKLWLTVMYWFFRFTTGIRAKQLADPTGQLEANGFVRLSQQRWRFGLVKSELWQRRW